jgi:radical SAM-linked protein
MRLRITFSKSGGLAYTSHLDLARVWERGLRRAAVPLVYSQGFNPRPKIQLGSALPLGHTGGAELLDVWLEKRMPIDRLAKDLVRVLPGGLAVSDVRQVELKEPALPVQIVSAEYQVDVETGETAKAIRDRIGRILQSEELPRERARAGRKAKAYDLRPLIEWLKLVPADGSMREGVAVLDMQLAARQGATARPEAVLAALGMDGGFARYHRRRLLLQSSSVGEK